MTASSYALSLCAAISVIWAFYTGTLMVIVDLALASNVYALTFCVGFFGVLLIGMKNMASRGRFTR